MEIMSHYGDHLISCLTMTSVSFYKTAYSLKIILTASRFPEAVFIFTVLFATIPMYYLPLCPIIRGYNFFFGKFGVLYFLITPVLRLTLLSYYRRHLLHLGQMKRIESCFDHIIPWFSITV